MSKYSKFFASLIAVASAVGAALKDGHIDGVETAAIAGAVIASFGVWAVTNTTNTTNTGD